MATNPTMNRLGIVISIVLSVGGIAASLAGLVSPSLTEKVIYGGYLSSVAGLLLCLFSLKFHRIRGFWVFVGWWAAGAFLGTFLAIPFSVMAMLSTALIHLPLLALFCHIRRTRKVSTALACSFYFAAFIIAVFLPHYLAVSFSTRYPLEAESIKVASDQLEDKNPSFVDQAEMWKKEPIESSVFGPISCEINKSGSVVGLDLAELKDDEESTTQALYATYKQAMDDARSKKLSLVPSVQMIDHKAKVHADQLLAAVEAYLFNGVDETTGPINAFLADVLGLLVEAHDGTQASTEAIAYVAAALALGEQAVPSLAADASTRAQRMQDEFLASPIKSKPVGFYADSEELRRLFRQGRFLQTRASVETAIKIAGRIKEKPDLAVQYQRFLMLYSGLCNPPSCFSVMDVASFPEYFSDPSQMVSSLLNSRQYEIIRSRGGGRIPGEVAIQLLPHATSRENQLFARLYNESADLPRHSVMNRLVEAIRTGELDLTPKVDSGWYDYQIHALETLLLPDKGQEGSKLLLTDRYKRNLIDAFRTILTKKRELHIKNVELIPTLGVRIEGLYLRIAPDLRVEPTATYYLRTARGLRFILNVLQAALGNEVESLMLDKDTSLRQKTEEMAALYYGLYLTVCADIGMTPSLMAEEMTQDRLEHSRHSIEKWLTHYREDACYGEDVRYIVPALTNAEGTEIRYWMTIGVRLAKAKAEYVRRPAVRILDSDSGKVVQELPVDAASGHIRDSYMEYKFVPKEFYLPVEVFAEATGPAAPLTRAEFRALCDRCTSKDEIVRAVGLKGTASRERVMYVVGGLAVFAILVVFWLRKARRWRAVPSSSP